MASSPAIGSVTGRISNSYLQELRSALASWRDFLISTGDEPSEVWLSVVDSGAYEQLFYEISTCVTNVTAGKVIGVARSARLPVLLVTAGMKSFHNLYMRRNA